MYQPKTGQPCNCKPGVQRDNCPRCEGTGKVIDFAKIRTAKEHYGVTVRHGESFSIAYVVNVGRNSRHYCVSFSTKDSPNALELAKQHCAKMNEKSEKRAL